MQQSNTQDRAPRRERASEMCKPSLAIKMVAGMAGGLVEACALQPFDVTKTRLQLHRGSEHVGMLKCMRGIVIHEGVRGLYKGLTPFCMQLTAKYAMRFGTFGWVDGMMRRAVPIGPSRLPEAARHFAAGFAAGVVEAVVIVTPFEVVKTRLQEQAASADRVKVPHAAGRCCSRARRNTAKYSSTAHCARTIVREEGVSALWRGLLPTVFRQSTNQSFNFMAYAAINRHVWDRHDGDGKTLAPTKVFATGLVSSCIGPLFNAPMDVIKTRFQASRTPDDARAPARSSLSRPRPRCDSIPETIRGIVRDEGVLALWKGIVPRLARLAPGQAITWTVVSHVTHRLERGD